MDIPGHFNIRFGGKFINNSNLQFGFNFPIMYNDIDRNQLNANDGDCVLTSVDWAINIYDSSTSQWLKIENLFNTCQNRGIFSGNTVVPQNIIEYISINSSCDSSYFGNLFLPKYDFGTTSNGVGNIGLMSGGLEGYWWAGGNTEYVNISILSNSTEFAAADGWGWYVCMTSNGILNSAFKYGTYPSWNAMIKYNLVSKSIGVYLGEVVTSSSYWDTITSNCQNNRAIIARETSSWYYSLQTHSSAIIFGTISRYHYLGVATSNGILNRGIFVGSNSIPTMNMIDYITITTPANSIVFGDLSSPRGWRPAACSNHVNNRAVFVGGWTTAVDYNYAWNTMEYVTISTMSNGSSFGSLSNPGYGFSGTSNS